MKRVALAEKAAASWSGLVQYAIATWVGRAVGDTVLNYMNVDAFAKIFAERFFLRPLDDFLNTEIRTIRVFTVQQSGHNPHFVGYFELFASCRIDDSNLILGINMLEADYARFIPRKM